jgi:predicted metal-dependent peptidase
MAVTKEQIKENAKKMISIIDKLTKVKRVRLPARIEAVSVKWVRDAPFFSEFLMRFNYFETEAIPTMGVNCIKGRINLYINTQFMNGGGKFYKFDKEGKPIIKMKSGKPELDDQGNVIYEMEAWKGLNDDQLEAVLLHEIMHLIRVHHERTLEDPYIFNIAGDMLINEDLKTMQIGNRKPTLPDGAVYLSQAQKEGYKDEAITEKLYIWLIDQRQKYMNTMQDLMKQQGKQSGQKQQCSHCGGSGKVDQECSECGGKGTVKPKCPDCGGSGQKQNQQGQGNQKQDGKGQGKDQNGEGQDGQDQQGQGQGQGEQEGDGQGHSCPSCHGSGKDQNGQDEPCPSCGGGGHEEGNCPHCGGSGNQRGSDLFDAIYGSKIDDHSSIEQNDELTEATIREIIETGKIRGWGNISGEAIEKLEELTKPSKISWKQILRRYLTAAIHDVGNIYENSWAKRNRRQLPLPGIKKLNNRVIIGIDTSGSIGKREFQVFFTEVERIVKDTSNIILLQWDTEIKDVKMGYKKGDWRKIAIKGRGGTDVQKTFDWMVENKYTTYPLIMFTDGYFDHNFDTHAVKVVWCVTVGENKIPGGDNIYIEMDDK